MVGKDVFLKNRFPAFCSLSFFRGYGGGAALGWEESLSATLVPSAVVGCVAERFTM